MLQLRVLRERELRREVLLTRPQRTSVNKEGGETALARFRRNVEASHEDPDNVTWRDENTMYEIARTY